MNCLNFVLRILLPLSFFSQSLLAAVEITPGVVYQSGTQLKASNFGIEFTIPENWQAILPQGGEALMMEPNNEIARIAISAEANSSEFSIRQTLMQDQALNMHAQMIPKSQVKIEDNVFSQQYYIEGFNQQNLEASLYVLLGKNNVAVAAMLLEPIGKTKYSTLVKTLLKSVTFSVPVEEEQSTTTTTKKINWDQELRGITLKYLSTSNGLSIDKRLNLCSNSQFSYSDNDSYLSSSGVDSFSANSQAALQGTWKIKANKISLQWSDGTFSEFILSRRFVSEWNEWGTYLNNDRWFVVKNEVCS